MNPKSPVVVKLGGSLLTLPNLSERLHAVVESLYPQKVLIVVGGGAAADEIRRLDAFACLTAAQAHWNAIAAMTYNAEILSRVSGYLPVVSNRLEAAKLWQQHDAILLNTTTFLKEEKTLYSRSLPESWSVTSDSISAFVALHWPAKQVVFCKSRDLTSPPHVERLCQNGLLDEWLPNLVSPLQQSGVQLQWFNLRAAMSQVQTFNALPEASAGGRPSSVCLPADCCEPAGTDHG